MVNKQFSSYTHNRDMLYREIQALFSNKEFEFETKKPTEGYLAWAQETLNFLLGLSLIVDNKSGNNTEQALKIFQSKTGLTETGKLDYQTERKLLEEKAIGKTTSGFEKKKIELLIAIASSKIEDWTSKAVIPEKKKNLILRTFRDPRILTSLVLHQMAYKAKDKLGQFSNPEKYLTVGAHFCIMLDGRIIQYHPISRFIWHSNCTSSRSIGVEFEGNFPNIKGKWWYDRSEVTGKLIKANEDMPTQAQFEAGQFLLTYLKAVINLKNVLAHRQSSENRENDPGPDIWVNVGEWGISQLGLSDGGQNFKCGTGNPILPKWRTWKKIV
jgi:N-acetylmuramoyl-L-alanine amidase/Putative peptidoglycan binding domain